MGKRKRSRSSRQPNYLRQIGFSDVLGATVKAAEISAVTNISTQLINKIKF